VYSLLFSQERETTFENGEERVFFIVRTPTGQIKLTEDEEFLEERYSSA
jgi:hypothetical protein